MRYFFAIFFVLILCFGSVSALGTLKRIDLRSCNSTGQILLYEGNASFLINPNVTFQTGYDQMLIAANRGYHSWLNVTVDGVPQSLPDYWPNNVTPKRNNIVLMVNTTPGSIINFTAGVGNNGTRGIQAFILQNSWNPILMPNLRETHDSYSISPTYLYPGKQDVIFFDKYRYNRYQNFLSNELDHRKLNITVAKSDGTIVFFDSYDFPSPEGIEGIILSTFNILQEGYYVVRTDTEDSIYWGTCMPHCGNGILETALGEECDDNNYENGDGCDTMCRLTDCDVCTASIAKSIGCDDACSMNDVLLASFRLLGSSCNAPETIQIDYYSEDNSCMIQRSGVNMYGINSGFSAPVSLVSCNSNNYDFDYIIPSILDACAGKNLTKVIVGLYSDNYTVLRSNEYYFGDTNSIILDQCSQFGTVIKYRWLPINAIYSLFSGDYCIANTCHDYDAVPVIINNTAYGVHVYNTSADDYDYYACGVNDGLCPDDFAYGTSCGINGVCSTHSVPDADCMPLVQMNCGLTFNPLTGNNIASCDVPVPVPSLGCLSYSDCVYADEVTGDNPQCYPIGAKRSNALGYGIECMNMNNTWCPEGFGFSMVNGRCRAPIDACGSTFVCPEVREFVGITGVPGLNDPLYNRWRAYIASDDCFKVNAATGRRNMHCWLIRNWPIPGFNYTAISVPYRIVNTTYLGIYDSGSTGEGYYIYDLDRNRTNIIMND